MSEPTTKRKKTRCVAKLAISPVPVVSPQERVFFTRDYLVNLVIPRLLTHDNARGIMDLRALYGVCRRTRELVGTNFLHEFEAMRRWIEEHGPEGDPRCTPEHALVVGAMASFRYFLYFFYRKTVPGHREGESREAAWDRQWHEPPPGLSRVYMSDYMDVVRRCAWIAGQRGHLEAIQDIANVGIAAMREECIAKRAGLTGKAMFSRPLKIAMKGAASRGRTQMCKDIFTIVYCRAQRTAPAEVMRRQFAPGITDDPYHLFSPVGMKYAAERLTEAEKSAREDGRARWKLFCDTNLKE